MHFPEKLVSIIIQCVSSVQFQVLINGEPTISFKPSRGIRQGHPLSPYLFILCDGLSCLIQRTISNDSWKGVQMGRNAHVLSHLFFFADDCLLFLKDSQLGC